MSKLSGLISEIEACRVCAAALPCGPRPVVRLGAGASILVIGQAPGTKVHASGVPWDDASGMRLRRWMGVTAEQFYDVNKVAIMPMGFCYPGRGSSGDLPPRGECAPLWHDKILRQLPKVKLTLLIGQYAQEKYLNSRRLASLTETVRAWRDYMPQGFLPLVHPSPRNGIWLRKNPWFEDEVVPELQKYVSGLIAF